MTLGFYDNNGDDFFRNTVNIDLSHIYAPFLKQVPQDAHILDAGCGSGRDSKYFLERGYRVTAFDGSRKMAQLASEYTGLDVLHITFDEMTWQDEFDAIWANASLLHLPMLDLLPVFVKLAHALKRGGVMYVSFKWGQGNRTDDKGRHFTYCDEVNFPALLARYNDAEQRKYSAALPDDYYSRQRSHDEQFEISNQARRATRHLSILQHWKTPDERPERAGEYWFNVILYLHHEPPIPLKMPRDDVRVGSISKALFLEQHTREFGTANPQVMDKPFWKLMVRTGHNAWWARQQFHSTPAQLRGAVWCFERFGMSETVLNDGRKIYIAGEHEDYYDPDFCIYNDVIVMDADGEITIYGYPRDVFPPTDFHTATRVGEYIYIIGNMGYMDVRVKGFTPVYRLNLKSFAIEKVETSGEMPGWIAKHEAAYDAAAHQILVTGGELIMQWDGEQVEETTPGLPEMGIEPYTYTRNVMPQNEAIYALDLSTRIWSKS